MADPKFQPVRHDHKAFLDKATKRPGFNEAYEALKTELIPTDRKWRKMREPMFSVALYKRDGHDPVFELQR